MTGGECEANDRAAGGRVECRKVGASATNPPDRPVPKQAGLEHKQEGMKIRAPIRRDRGPQVVHPITVQCLAAAIGRHRHLAA